MPTTVRDESAGLQLTVTKGSRFTRTEMQMVQQPVRESREEYTQACMRKGRYRQFLEYVTASIVLFCASCTCEPAARSNRELFETCDYNLVFNRFKRLCIERGLLASSPAPGHPRLMLQQYFQLKRRGRSRDLWAWDTREVIAFSWN